jgi:hypothetical protein
MGNDLEQPSGLFEYWLLNMDNALEAFFSTLPPEVASRLDYSDVPSTPPQLIGQAYAASWFSKCPCKSARFLSRFSMRRWLRE